MIQDIRYTKKLAGSCHSQMYAPLRTLRRSLQTCQPFFIWMMIPSLSLRSNTAHLRCSETCSSILNHRKEPMYVLIITRGPGLIE